MVIVAKGGEVRQGIEERSKRAKKATMRTAPSRWGHKRKSGHADGKNDRKDCGEMDDHSSHARLWAEVDEGEKGSGHRGTPSLPRKERKSCRDKPWRIPMEW